MTENKRFTVDKDGRTILDNIDDSYCECVDGYEAKQYCGKLNELAEENKQYHEWLDSLREELSLADRDNTALEKENKELKIKNDLLSEELEEAKAVIHKKWGEYLKKKELQE